MKQENKKLNIHKLFWYFVLFSILGLIIETIFCYITTGVLESRKGLIWGPFCPVYGVGAVIMIISLNNVKSSGLKVFLVGGIVGGLIEYVLSFGLEAIYSSRFWDYSYLPFNLNGRICLTYSLYWGVLAVVLIKYIKPKIDNILNNFNGKKVAILEKIIFIFLVISTIVTIWGTTVYKNRAIDIYFNNIEEDKEEKNIIERIEENYFTNERMLKTFPNLRVQIEGENEIFIKDILELEK